MATANLSCGFVVNFFIAIISGFVDVNFLGFIVYSSLLIFSSPKWIISSVTLFKNGLALFENSALTFAAYRWSCVFING